MGLVYQMNKDYKEIMQAVNANPDSGLRVVHQPESEGKQSLWPWGITHEATATFGWFEGYYIHTWGTNVGKGENLLKPLRKLGFWVDDCF